MHGLLAFLALIFLVTAPTVIPGAELLDGKKLYTQYQCQICHGGRGEQPARGGYPVIAGQDKIYLVQQILDIRDGVRDNSQSDLMRPMVKSVSNEEAEAIAVYLSMQ